MDGYATGFLDFARNDTSHAFESERIPAFVLSKEWGLARIERTKSHDLLEFESSPGSVST
jgi:hypothetical protein